MTNKEIGRIGLSMAINYFTLQGYTISLPLNDTQWYDLIIEKDGIFKTVQCKATMTDNDFIDLRSTGGNKGYAYDNVVNHPIDYLFCVNKDFICWLIPMDKVREANYTSGFKLKTTNSSPVKQRLDTTQYIVNFIN